MTDALRIVGVVPAATATPTSAAACVETFRSARHDRHAVACVGGGTELDLGAPPSRLDLVVRTTSLARVLDYTPEDQVVDVEGGITLGALQAALGARGQRLAFDPPGAADATVGGLVATNAFGPLRTRYGSLRDLIIGVTLLRADGVVARGGGKVVKTVAGFDLPKLAVGSLGTLGMILGATFRVHPLPEAHATVAAEGLSSSRVRAFAVAMRDAQLEPARVVAIGAGDRYAVGVAFEGFAAGVLQQRERMVAEATKSDVRAEVLDDAAAAGFWSGHDAARLTGDARLKLSAPPKALARLLPEAMACADPTLAEPKVVWYPTLGLAFVCGTASEPSGLAAMTERVRRLLAPERGFAVVERAPVAARAGLDVWGSRGAGHGLMKLVKARFDPEDRMNPGRLLEGA